MTHSDALPDGARIDRKSPDGDYDSYVLQFGDFGIPFRVPVDSNFVEVQRRALRILARFFVRQ